MTLFDAIQRTDLGSAARSEPDFAYLNRTARPEFGSARHMLEEWFARYPASAKADVRGRFRDTSNENHESALFELALHELLCRLGCDVTPHPAVHGVQTTPDFLVEDATGARFYLEAVLADDRSSSHKASLARLNQVLDTLDRFLSPSFFLGLDICDWLPAQPVPGAKIRVQLRRWLGSLNPDEVAALYARGDRSAIPHFLYPWEGRLVRFFPIPKKAEARGKPGHRLLGMGPMRSKIGGFNAAIRAAVLEKVSKCGNPDLPYVVAVKMLDWGVPAHDVERALFGLASPQALMADARLAGPVDCQGVWTSPGGPRNTRVSAVLAVGNLWPLSVPRASFCLYHKPWAKKPCRSALTRLPQARLTGDGIVYSSAMSAAAVYGLSEDRPSREAADASDSG